MSKVERLVCINETSLFYCYYGENDENDTDQILWNKRLGMIPLDAIDKLVWQSKDNF